MHSASLKRSWIWPDLAGVQTEQLCQKGEHYVESGNDRALGQMFGFVAFHNVSFSFVLGEEGLELTGGYWQPPAGRNMLHYTIKKRQRQAGFTANSLNFAKGWSKIKA